MAILPDVLLRGTRAAQPSAATTAEGTLYFVTDEGVTEQVESAAWVAYSAVSGSLGIDELTGDVTAGPGTGSVAATLAATAVVAGTYGDATNVAQVIVDAKGRLTSATNVPISGLGTGITQLTGDVTAGPGSGSVPATIPADTVTDAMLRNSAALSVIGNATNSSANPADIAAASDGQVMRRSGTAIAFGAVDLASANAVTGTLPNANVAASGLTRQITITLNGGGVPLTTGAQQVYLSIPVSCTITKWRILADAIGDIVLDIWVEDYAGFPPVVGDSITAAAKPTLSGGVQQKNESSSLGTWITALVAGDVMEINIDSTSAVITKLILSLDVTVT